MADTNYFSGIIKILEFPQQKFITNNILVTQIRGEIAQFRSNQFVLITFWGNFGNEFKNYYRVNDYIIIEGYLSIQKKSNNKLALKNRQKILITCLKAYPFLLKSKNLI